jgi:PAS domain S-box-containing protein
MQQQLALRERALAATAEGITIADARLPDNPLIYANAGFERLTGYSVSEVLGKNCRFLQGQGTDQATLERLRAAIRERREVTVLLLNYRKDGSAFWNRLSVTPVRDASGEVTHFIGVQSDVTEQKRTEEALNAAMQMLETANLRMKRDLDAAAMVQRSLLPSSLPHLDRANFAWEFRPSKELAGDALNVFALDAHRAGFYILDVSGHGVAAALLSVTLSHFLSPMPGQSLLYEADGRISSPAIVAERLNRRFPLDLEVPQFFTLFYGILDIQAGDLRYVLAGQNPLAHVPRDGPPRMLHSGGLPIGLFADTRYEEQRLRVEPYDRLCLYTDGVVEAENTEGRQFGEDSLLCVLDRARHLPIKELANCVMTNVDDWTGRAGLSDDASVLVVEILD